MNSRLIGAYGESLAAAYYRKQGYSLVTANYRTRHGEIDCIVKKGDLLVFVEVKTRKAGSITMGREAVTLQKQKKIVLAAQQYLACHVGFECPVRFDVYEVTYQNGVYQGVCIENAFEL